MLKRMIDAVRRNHALEHATISVLLSRHTPRGRIVGRAVSDGFYIYSDIQADRLREFAQEGLSRLQRGESHLAISPQCGTNLAVAGLLAGLAAYLALASRGNRLDSLPGALLATLVAVMAAQPLGGLVQRRVTTLAELKGVRIISVEPVGKGLFSIYKVRTAFSPPV